MRACFRSSAEGGDGRREMARLLRKAADLVESGDMTGDIDIQEEFDFVRTPRSWYMGPDFPPVHIVGYNWTFRATGNSKAEP